MDETRFDQSLKIFAGSAGGRRDALRAVSAAGMALLAGLAGLVPLLGDAKKGKNKKKKCKKPKVKCKKKCCAAGQVCKNGKCAPGGECQFTKTATLWTLQSNCTITKTIEIPDGVSLDGNGKTIALSGPFAPFVDGFGGVRSIARDVSVKDLTLDGSGVTGDCDGFAGQTFPLLWWDGDQIADVDVRDNACGRGILALGASVTGVTVSGIRQNGFAIGIEVGGSGTSSVSNSTVRDTDRSILLSFGTSATVENNTIEDALVGIECFDLGVAATIENNTITNTVVGARALAGASMNVTNNTIVGPGSTPVASFGIDFQDEASGSASGNTISDFMDDDPAETSCGIRVAANAGAVTIGTNTFPDPPGNEQDVCDLS